MQSSRGNVAILRDERERKRLRAAWVRCVVQRHTHKSCSTHVKKSCCYSQSFGKSESACDVLQELELQHRFAGAWRGGDVGGVGGMACAIINLHLLGGVLCRGVALWGRSDHPTFRGCESRARRWFATRTSRRTGELACFAGECTCVGVESACEAHCYLRSTNVRTLTTQIVV